MVMAVDVVTQAKVTQVRNGWCRQHQANHACTETLFFIIVRNTLSRDRHGGNDGVAE